MRGIYSISSRAIIWLGDAPDASGAYAFFVTLLGKSAEDVSEEVFLGLTAINEDNPRCAALSRMLNNPYWARVWIVQEVVVS